MWIALGILFALGIGWFVVHQTSKLNNDPVQMELADLILEMMSRDATSDAQTLFQVSASRVLMTRMIDPKQWQTRLAHALTLAKPQLNEMGYAVARSIIRGMT